MARVELELSHAYHGDLPSLCIRCGAPATVFKDRTFFTGLCGLPFLPLLFLVIVAGRVSIRVPFCEIHKYHWRRRTQVVFGTFAFGLVVGISSCFLWLDAFLVPGRPAAWHHTLGGVICPLVPLLWIGMALILKYKGVYLANYNQRSVTLEGVAEEFAEEVRLWYSQNKFPPPKPCPLPERVRFHIHFHVP
jgi:hypothetical protein